MARRTAPTPRAMPKIASAEAAISPPVKPPPGSLWPRSRTKTENSSISAVEQRRDGAEDQRVHGRSTPRSSGASGSFSASLRSVCGAHANEGEDGKAGNRQRPRSRPSVSVPRKSTMMTFTTLAPWAIVLE